MSCGHSGQSSGPKFMHCATQEAKGIEINQLDLKDFVKGTEFRSPPRVCNRYHGVGLRRTRPGGRGIPVEGNCASETACRFF